MTLIYRPAIPADAPTLDRLFDTVFSDTFGHLYAPEDLHAFLTSSGIAEWEAEIADPAYAFRLAEDEEVIGYVKLGPMTLPIEVDVPSLLLDQFYILKPWHGCGIAQVLMDWALEEARRRGTKEFYLSVFVDNHHARRFYENYGFEVVSQYHFMVGNHADEDLIMRKRL